MKKDESVTFNPILAAGARELQEYVSTLGVSHLGCLHGDCFILKPGYCCQCRMDLMKKILWDHGRGEGRSKIRALGNDFSCELKKIRCCDKCYEWLYTPAAGDAIVANECRYLPDDRCAKNIRDASKNNTDKKVTLRLEHSWCKKDGETKCKFNGSDRCWTH